jgi:hypothetical protein
MTSLIQQEESKTKSKKPQTNHSVGLLYKRRGKCLVIQNAGFK